ncbi:UNVERIFIED_ORG: Ca2+-binding RTX toxin-like protein [Ensifer adhaerens]|nr:Ca2+-binding RTX toxin-like protein [Ensifer adhaerens]
MDTDNFVVRGSTGKDSFLGRNHADVIRGGAGDDRIYGRTDYFSTIGDRLIGGDGNDKIIGSNGHDAIYGGNGDDRMRGMSGQDIIKGGAGSDIISGDGYCDKLWGDSGDDFLNGGRDNDTLSGGTGDDELWGGWGIDRFIFENDAGDDVIGDFKPGKAGKDLIVFGDIGFESFGHVMDHPTQVTGGVMITYDEGSLFGACAAVAT